MNVGEDIHYSRLYEPINSIRGFAVRNLKFGYKGGTLGVDVSGSGRGDPAVMMYWEGFHLEDVACILAGGETQKLAVMDFAKKHEVPIERICYDATGLGSVYEEYFTGAVNFIAKFPAFDKKPVLVGGRMQEYSNYENVRAQVFDNLAKG